MQYPDDNSVGAMIRARNGSPAYLPIKRGECDDLGDFPAIIDRHQCSK
jgi:hypothetical protein